MKAIRVVLKQILAVLIAALFMFPIYYFLVVSFLPKDALFSYPPPILPIPFTLSNYPAAMSAFLGFQGLKNSLIVGIAVTVITLAVGTPAAYSLARFRTGGRNLPFWILSQRMMPPIAAIIPLFLLMRSIRMVDTLQALVIAQLITVLPFGIWFVRGFFAELPVEMEEAALIDGCSRMGALWRIALPLAAPGIAVTGLLAFVLSWNELLFAVVLTRGSSMTLPVAMANATSAHGIAFTILAALAMVSIFPAALIAIVAQRYLVRGLTLGALQ